MKLIYQCKICNKDTTNKIYCSNKCKFSDTELNKSRKRKIVNDNSKILECNICNWTTKDILNTGGHPLKHLKNNHL